MVVDKCLDENLNQITLRNILKSSGNQSMRELFEITRMKNIRNDSIVKRSANAKVAKATLDSEIQNEIITSMTKLKEQNTLLCHYNKMLRKLRLETGIYLLSTFRQIYLTFAEKP